MFVLTGVAYPCYVWAYACEYIFSPSLIKTRYKTEIYNPDQVREKIPKWIAEYQDKTVIRQFREAGLYKSPGLEAL